MAGHYERFEPDLVVRAEGGVRVVTFNRPATMNSVTGPFHKALAGVWPAIAEDDEARAVVLTGAGEAFSAGGDLDHIVELHEDQEMRRREGVEATEIVQSMISCRLPVISAVNGPAVGLGCSVALFADLVYLAESAYLADPHVAIGLTAGDGGAAVWPVLASMVQAKEYLYTGDRISAAEAVRLGLATRAVPDDELLPTALAMAERLGNLPPQAFETTKRALNMHLRRAVAGVLEYAAAAEFQSFDTPEHRQRFAKLRERMSRQRPGS
ncbi:MAG TPA: enoyl-CoA hydratase-related protein [Acidimicrobiales bacterium]|nr:enoyl-CoA hydratase-related protein [Acidimicrobiales bacterium]